MLHWTLFGFIWWQFLLSVIYVVIIVIKSIHLVGASYWYSQGKYRISWTHSMKEVFFDGEKYFTVYDILRMMFFLPSIVMGTALIMLRAGAHNLFPFLRKVLGYKLFAVEKDVKKNV